MNDVLKTVLSLSVSASLVGGLLLAFRPLYRDRLQKTWQYYIWLVVILRLLLPFAPEANLINGLVSWAEIPVAESGAAPYYPSKPASQRESQETAAPGEEATVPLTPSLAEESKATVWEEIRENLWLGWLGVALLLLVRKVTSYHSFARFIRAGRVPVDDPEILDAYDDLCRSMKQNKPLPLYQNDLAVSPMLVGILHPYIVLPDASIKGQELELVLRHELVHFKRRDILYKWLVQVAVCVHWFNPLVYVFHREIAKNCELACDEAVLIPLGEEKKHSYGNTLLATLKGGGSYGDTVASVTMSEDGKMLKERLEAILQSGKKSGVVTVCSAAIAVVLLCGSAFAGAYTGSKAMGESKTPLSGTPETFQMEADSSPAETSGEQWIDGSYTKKESGSQGRFYSELQNTYYKDNYLYTIRWRADDDIQLYEAAIPIKCGSKDMKLAFVRDTVDYANDDTLIELVRQSATEKMQEYPVNVRWDEGFFSLMSASGPHSETPDELLRKAYDNDNIANLYTLASHAGDEVKEELLYRAYEDDRDDYFMFLINEMPKTFDVDALADRAVKEEKWEMLLWLSGYISADKRREVEQVNPLWGPYYGLEDLEDWDQDFDEMDDMMDWKEFGQFIRDLQEGDTLRQAQEAFNNNRVNEFKALMHSLSEDVLEAYAKRAFDEMKYEFQTLLMDYMD